MTEEKTKNLNDDRSFEERVFARFDAMETLLLSLVERVENLEQQAERRAVETKPMWEKALAEILEVKDRLENIEIKIDHLTHDVMQVRTEMKRVERRVDKLESSPSS